MYTVGLLPSDTWKKPAPLIARSIGFSVIEMLPCVNCWATVWTCTPMPTSLVPAPLSEAAYMSANSARDDLAP